MTVDGSDSARPDSEEFLVLEEGDDIERMICHSEAHS
jgi:hypothetical protein